MAGKRSQRRLKSQPSSRRDDDNHGAYCPEGGWGYVVVFAAFFALMIQMGIIVSMGVYLEYIEQEFHAGAGIGGWISSGCFAVLAFASPIAGHTMKRFGCRVTATVGGAIMCAGFVCGTFANSAIQLFIFADVVAGFGGSLTHISATVVIGQYFNRRYALANCFAYTGQGVGIMIFPPILHALIQTYGWRGCMFVQGALTLHISVAASLYRPVRVPRDHARNQHERLRKKQKSGEMCTGDEKAIVFEQKQMIRASNSRVSDSVLDKSDQTEFPDEAFDSTAVSVPGCLVDAVVQTEFSDELVNSQTVSDHTSRTTSSVDSIVCLTEVGVQTQFAHEESLARFLAKEDQFLDGGRRGKCPWRLCPIRFSCVSTSLIFIYAVFLFETFGYGGFFAHIVAKGHELSVTDGQAIWALSIFGVGSLTGRITHGWIIDRDILSPRTVNALSLVISGGASALVAIADNIPGILAGAFFAGLGSGWYLPLQQVLLRNVVGQSRLHLAYGYGLVFEGAGSLAGGYVIGLIRDVTGNYVMAYCTLGFVFFLGVVVFILDCFFEKKRSSLEDLHRDVKLEQSAKETLV